LEWQKSIMTGDHEDMAEIPRILPYWIQYASCLDNIGNELNELAARRHLTIILLTEAGVSFLL